LYDIGGFEKLFSSMTVNERIPLTLKIDNWQSTNPTPLPLKTETDTQRKPNSVDNTLTSGNESFDVVFLNVARNRELGRCRSLSILPFRR
jgi:hypothetical protein